MPPKNKVYKTDILAASLRIVREDGEEGLNARAIASRLHCSTQPVFSNYASMEELRQAVIAEAYAVYTDYQDKEQASGKYPPYKASGMAYIRFAREEKELFKLLFMRDRSAEAVDSGKQYFDSIVELIQRQIGLSHKQAQKFHLETWIYVHGIATMLATNYLELDEGTISGILTDVYEGMKTRFAAAEAEK